MAHFNPLSSGMWMNVTTNNTCPDGIPWIQRLLGECVLDVKHYTAVICGIVSIIAWFLNGIPQMVENCRRGIPDEAVSPWLLIFWTIGDTFNLVGCILSHQLPLQKWSAAYSIVCDCILIAQYVFALLKHRNEHRLLDKRGEEGNINVNYDNLEETNSTIDIRSTGRSLAGVFAFFIITRLGSSLIVPMTTVEHTSVVKGRQLLYYQPVFFNAVDIAGYALGITSSIFYFSARIPQLYKNFIRKTTDGLSMGLFVLAVIGNSTYGLQIFLTSVDIIFLIRHTPWLCGSLGVLLMDFFMLFQFFLYRHNVPIEIEIDSDDEVEIIQPVYN